jgi:hypothetical protein
MTRRERAVETVVISALWLVFIALTISAVAGA